MKKAQNKGNLWISRRHGKVRISANDAKNSKFYSCFLQFVLRNVLILFQSEFSTQCNL